MKMRNRKRGQGLFEYMLTFSLVILAVIGVGILIKRGVAGRLADTANQIGSQFTTNEQNTMETRQQSFRDEKTGVKDASGQYDDWTKSTVMTTVEASATNLNIADVGAKEAAYTGHETNRQDWVAQNVGAGAIGAHGVYDSGKLSEIGIHDDD